MTAHVIRTLTYRSPGFTKEYSSTDTWRIMLFLRTAQSHRAQTARKQGAQSLACI